jgi:cis-3-alkyl-4-acyloxetan-2-one decarboxylase
VTDPRQPPPALPDWLAAMLPLERSVVEVDGHRLHVMEQGRGAGRPVLLLHGNPSWGFLYRKVAAALAGEPLHLVMPDLFGLGLSDKPRDPAAHTLEAHGAAIAGLIERLELRDLVLVVQDWGGPIGLWAMAGMADRLAGLVILNTVVGPPRPGFKPTAFHRFARLPVISDLAFRGLGAAERGMALAQGDRRSIRGEVARAYRWPLRDRADRVAPLALARMVPDGPSHPTMAALGRCHDFITRFAGPIAIVWGDRDPVLGRVRSHLERLLPQAPVTRTAAGHFLQEEVPDEIAAAVRDVVARAGRD